MKQRYYFVGILKTPASCSRYVLYFKNNFHISLILILLSKKQWYLRGLMHVFVGNMKRDCWHEGLYMWTTGNDLMGYQNHICGQCELVLYIKKLAVRSTYVGVLQIYCGQCESPHTSCCPQNRPLYRENSNLISYISSSCPRKGALCKEIRYKITTEL